jgi:hypothetical protein
MFFLTYVPWLWSCHNYGVSHHLAGYLGHCSLWMAQIHHSFIIFWHVMFLFPKRTLWCFGLLSETLVFPFFSLLDMFSHETLDSLPWLRRMARLCTQDCWGPLLSFCTDGQLLPCLWSPSPIAIEIKGP